MLVYVGKHIKNIQQRSENRTEDIRVQEYSEQMRNRGRRKAGIEAEREQDIYILISIYQEF